MIYLIDDNQNNQRFENYNISFTDDDSYSECLQSIEKLKKGKNLSDISHLSFLENAVCILLHSTTEDYDQDIGFISGSRTNVLKIKELISADGEKIPLVMFSNSMGNQEYNFQSGTRYISSIKKNLFYENLLPFLDHYKNTGEIELRVIAGGKNFVSKDILAYATEILDSIKFKDNSEELRMSDLSNVLTSFRIFVKLSFPKLNINEFFSHLEDDLIKIYEFKKKINLITESFTKYGRNIHTWK